MVACEITTKDGPCELLPHDYDFVLRAQMFEGRLALNPGLNLTRVSLSCVQKHFLG